MSNLTLSSEEMSSLAAFLDKSENYLGSDYNYKPENAVFACTCQGNCDGRTSGCSWG